MVRALARPKPGVRRPDGRTINPTEWIVREALDAYCLGKVAVDRRQKME
jgi:hypothetical protein